MKSIRLLSATLALFSAAAAQAANIGIGSNPWYTNTLQNNLIAQGHTVTVVNSYTAGSLASFDAYIQDGNAFFDSSLLMGFANNGGTVIEIPWSPDHHSLGLLSGRTSIVNGPNAAVTVHDAGSWLLSGVTLPSAGAHNLFSPTGNQFLAGTNQVLSWDDASDTALLGYKAVGAGMIVTFNLHLVTSDSQPLNAAWSNQIVYNAIGGPVGVPDSTSTSLIAVAFLGLVWARRRLR